MNYPSNLVYNYRITFCEKTSIDSCVFSHKPILFLRNLPFSTTEEDLWDLESKWWLEDWKDYILAHNFYLYWTEGGVA